MPPQPPRACASALAGRRFRKEWVRFVVLAFVFQSVNVLAQPYQPTAIWQREGTGDTSLYGSQVLALGDQNDDGLNDWAVYAAGRGWAPPGTPNEPKVEFFHGGNPPDTIPYMVRVKDAETEVAVRGARALGDLNGDGYVDWYIFTSYVGDPFGGHIYKIYFGGPGLHEIPDLILTSSILSGCEPIGDFNGDGFADLFLSGMDVPAVAFFGGSPMDTLPDWQRAADLVPDRPGDVNGDGTSDLACYNNTTGYTEFFFGATFPDTIPDDSLPSISLDIIQDVNGDGVDDLCFRGSGWGGISWGDADLDMIPEAELNFPCSGSGPMWIESAGDFNHDGFNDIVMLQPWCDNSNFGVLTLHLGHPWIFSEPAFVVYGLTPPLNLVHIKKAVSLGDVNGDGIDDLGVGANGGPEQIGYRGKAVVLRGDDSLIADAPTPPSASPVSFAISVYPNPFNSTATLTLHVPVAARVVVTMHDVLGRKVTQVADEVLSPGDYRLVIDGRDYPTGLYLVRAQFGTEQITEKVLLLR